MLGLLDLTHGRRVVDLRDVDIVWAETGLFPQPCRRSPAHVAVELAAVPASAVGGHRCPDGRRAPAGGAIGPTKNRGSRAVAYGGAHRHSERPHDLTGREH